MTIDRHFFTTPTGHLVLVGAVLLFGGLAIRWQQQHRQTPPLPPAPTTTAVALPRTFAREGVAFPKRNSPLQSAAVEAPAKPSGPASTAPRVLPMTLFSTVPVEIPTPGLPAAPFGRLVPCETINALESNRLETPVIGLVTEDVWHDGRLVVPAGAEVHGRAALDRTRERLAAEGTWRIVWRTPGRDNGTELTVTGLALDREFDAGSGRWGPHDGSAGLRGRIVKTDDERELKMFAATFLATATTALQDTRAMAGLLGEAALPAATARNAALAGTGAVLRDYAQAMREAIARDGFYLRVPAGKPFYLYVTQKLDRSQGRASLASSAPAHP